MTVSTNVLPDFQRDRILTQAIHSTGILPAGHTPKAELLAMAATYLDMEMLELQTRATHLEQAKGDLQRQLDDLHGQHDQLVQQYRDIEDERD